MNIQNNLSYYIDAKNEFSITGGGGSSCNISIVGGAGSNLNDYLYTSNDNNAWQLYLNTPHPDGEMRFSTLFSYPNDNSLDHGVKIDKFGRLQLYHNFDIINPLAGFGWFNVEGDLAGLKQSSLISSGEILVVQGQIAGINTVVGSHTTQINILEFDQTVHEDILRGYDFDEYEDAIKRIKDMEGLDVNAERAKAAFKIAKNEEITNNLLLGAGFSIGVGGTIAGIYNMIEMNRLSNIYYYTSNGVITQTENIEVSSNYGYFKKRSIENYLYNNSNMNLEQGFINSNIITTQFIPELKSDKILLGNITTPNVAYQMEMTGDLNLNMLYINSTSLSSLLNQKQGNLTFTQPLYNTTNTIGLNYDSSLQKLGNNLSVVKTATTPIVITGNDFSLSYDSSLTKIGNNLSVVKTASLPLSITGNNWALNYDSTLTLSGNNLSVVKTATTPIVITGNDFSLNYDSSLTKIGNNLSVVKTATTPIVITGNDFSLSYDSSLTKIGNNLSVVKTASLPLAITGNNWNLNYDSTLTLNGNNLSVAAATSSKWTTSGNNIYNNNIGNVGIGINAPSYKLHIEDGSVFIGDSAVGNGSQTDNGYKLVFDSSYTTTGTNKCNKILLHKNDTAPTYIAGFGIEAGALAYSVWTGGNHNFYTSTTTTSGGFLSFSIYKDNFRNYGSVNAGSGGVISNGNAGTSAYSYLSIANDTGNGILFLNSSTKTTDGGANTLTLRNDITGGDLRLSANLDTPYIYLKKSTGKIGIDTNNPLYKLHIEDGSLFVGDSAYTSSYSTTANGYKIIFDNTFNGTSGSGNICNKILLYNDTNFNGGLGIETGAVVYQSGERHRFYTGTSQTAYGFLSFDILKDQFNFYGNTDGSSGGYIRNASAGGSAHTYLGLLNNTGSFGGFFLNSSARTADGGANNMTVRNDAGDLILSAKSSTPQIYLQESTDRIYMNGLVNIRQGSGGGSYGVPTNYMQDGSLTIGSTNLNYGLGTGGWNANTAGLLLECYDNTEIAVHDAGQRLTSLIAYQGGTSYNTITIGRDMGSGWGTAWNVNIAGASLSLANEWYIVKGTTPTSVPNSLIFLHSTSTITSRWWLNGTQNGTSSEISDERIKKEIKDIDNPIEKLLLIKPKEYYLCSDKDYNKKYGVIAQDINKEESLKHLIYTDKEYIANLLTNAKFIKEKIGEEEPILEYPEDKYIKSENNPTPYQRPKPKEIFKYTITTEKNLNGLININDELKIVLDNDDINNIEIVIDDSPYNNRYKKRFVKVKEIIDDYSFEIYEDIDITETEKDNLFIYGKKVDDFLKLDYESLYCLNIKATQELYKIIQNQQDAIASASAQINILTKEINQIKNS